VVVARATAEVVVAVGRAPAGLGLDAQRVVGAVEQVVPVAAVDDYESARRTATCVDIAPPPRASRTSP
jgi:hypothetical protein